MIGVVVLYGTFLVLSCGVAGCILWVGHRLRSALAVILVFPLSVACGFVMVNVQHALGLGPR